MGGCWAGEAADGAQRPASMYTSGTAGRPKGVVKRPLKPGQGEMAAKLGANTFGPRHGMVSLLCGPCYHSPLDVQARQGLTYDADLIIQPRFDAEEFLSLIQI